MYKIERTTVGDMSEVSVYSIYIYIRQQVSKKFRAHII